MYINPIEILRDEALAKRGLPAIAYVDNTDESPGAAPILAIKRGEAGYHPCFSAWSADTLNTAAGVTKGQAEAMRVGSMMGWHAPGADPAMWDANGVPKGGR